MLRFFKLGDFNTVHLFISDRILWYSSFHARNFEVFDIENKPHKNNISSRHTFCGDGAF
jgi:hypothetical protein